jgi:hypothetical protein
MVRLGHDEQQAISVEIQDLPDDLSVEYSPAKSAMAKPAGTRLPRPISDLCRANPYDEDNAPRSSGPQMSAMVPPASVSGAEANNPHMKRHANKQPMFGESAHGMIKTAQA